MEYAEMLHRCFRCGWCKLPINFEDINCPAYLLNRFESFAAGGRLWLLRAWLGGEIKTSERFLEIMFSCATCRNCAEACGIPEIKDHIVDMIVAGRAELVAKGVLPQPVRNYLMSVYERGNPYRRPQAERALWAKGLDVPAYGGQEYLFFVGDEGAFDELGVKMTRAVANVLLQLGVSFGILGEEEYSDGNDVLALGERDLFQHTAGKNIEAFGKRGVKKIITLSPHSYNAMRREYPRLGGAFEVLHYTQVLAPAAKKLPLGEFKSVVAYHDPCYLGRWNEEYWPARLALVAVPRIKVVEMRRSMANALCCGGGGGNFHTAILGSGEMSAGRARVRDALAVGAQVLAVSCPLCRKMLDDAVKDEGAEEKLRVMDIAEILQEAMK